MNQPMRAVSHVGITVPDIDQAVAWYRDVFGFEPIAPSATVDVAEGGYLADLSETIFGNGIQKFKLAQLATANGAAIELFSSLSRRIPRRMTSSHTGAEAFHTLRWSQVTSKPSWRWSSDTVAGGVWRHARSRKAGRSRCASARIRGARSSRSCSRCSSASSAMEADYGHSYGNRHTYF